ncbi:MAG: hypothetical protein HYY35_11285, partial [Deltaproteobacteria bacterium]|nr:hypothetical protein [Deltaproteobacteria bacterium]
MLAKIRTLGALLALAGSSALGGAIPGNVALIGLDHQVYLADPNGGEPQPLTRGQAGRMAAAAGGVVAAGYRAAQERPSSEQRFSWPTWSPNGRTILVQGVTVAGNVAQQAGVYRIDLDHPGAVTPIYENRERGPIYLYYSPTGREVAVLVTEQGPLGLLVLGVADGALHPLGLGFPFYFSWRGDGDAIVTHTGGAPAPEHRAEIALIDVRRAREGGKPDVTRLSDRPVMFRAPAWS